jgi:hypothetical protein
MKKSLASLAALGAAFLALGVTTASAHGGHGVGGISTSKLVTSAASQLNVSRSSLVAAIQSSANTAIDAAVDDEDITSAQADDAKAEASDNLDYAYRWSHASTVASKLGISSAALNTGFRTARKALLNARIDAALTAGTITSDQATTLKAQVAALTAGYKSGGGFGGPGDFGGPGHGGH